MLSQLRCHSMGPQALLCFLPSPGWFLVTTSSLAKTVATAWLGSPDMQEAAATCEIRTWYHLSGSCESTQGGQRQHQLLGSEDGRQWGGMGLSAPVAGRGTCTLRGVLAIICLFHAPHTELVGPGGPNSSPQSWWSSIHSFGYPRALLGLPSGLNQSELPVLRLAVVHKDEVVELWQSPERSSEGWHQLVAYPGRIMGQFQVRQCWYPDTVPVSWDQRSWAMF